MKTILSHNRQLFNVDEIAAAGLTPDVVEEKKLAIIDITTNQTVSPASYKALPEEFRLLLKRNGKAYYSFDTIRKSTIVNSMAKEYQEAKPEIWKATIENCSCINSARLDIFLDEESIIRHNGLTWTSRDNYVEVSPEEFKCFCDCEGNSVYENNVMTMLLYKQIIEKNSPYYTAKVKKSTGEELEGLEAIKSFIKSKKAVNTDDDKGNDDVKLDLYLVGKVQEAGPYRDLQIDMKGVARGVAMKPVLTINEVDTITFSKEQELQYEIGSAFDLRAEEYDNMSLYTNMHTPTIEGGFADPELVYQFENGQKYDTVTFEFDSPKQNQAGEGDKKRFLILLGSKHDGGAFAKLSKIFKP